MKQGEDLLNRFIETIAVMLVTNCAIPVLVLVFMLWLLKMLLGTSGVSPAWQERLFGRKARHKTADD